MASRAIIAAVAAAAVGGCTTISVASPSAEECQVLEAAVNHLGAEDSPVETVPNADRRAKVSSLALPWVVMMEGGHVGKGDQTATDLQACPWFVAHARSLGWTVVRPSAYRQLLPNSGTDLVWFTRPERQDDGSYEVYLGEPGRPSGPVMSVKRKDGAWVAESAGFMISG